MKNQKSIGILGVLFLIFLTLKLAELGQVKDWSWWWVTSPLWVPFALAVGAYLICILLMFVGHFIDHLKK